jgi:uncharacterized protein (TIGR02594 family)
MFLKSHPIALAMAGLLVAALGTTAFAGPNHHARRHMHAAPIHRTMPAPAANASSSALAAGSPAEAARPLATAGASASAGGSSSVVEEARRYIGTNPTGRGSLWCGAFMDMVLKKTGHAGGGNLARAYARYGTRVAGPQVGAIAVMGRRGGGHVGVVSGIDSNGNPIIISGNHNRRVAESTYPRGRITAYVLPN